MLVGVEHLLQTYGLNQLAKQHHHVLITRFEIGLTLLRHFYQHSFVISHLLLVVQCELSGRECHRLPIKQKENQIQNPIVQHLQFTIYLFTHEIQYFQQILTPLPLLLVNHLKNHEDEVVQIRIYLKFTRFYCYFNKASNYTRHVIDITVHEKFVNVLFETQLLNQPLANLNIFF